MERSIDRSYLDIPEHAAVLQISYSMGKNGKKECPNTYSMRLQHLHCTYACLLACAFRCRKSGWMGGVYTGESKRKGRDGMGLG